MYDPTVGRFPEEDPIGLAGGGTNLYRYCDDSPTGATDPTGLGPPAGGAGIGSGDSLLGPVPSLSPAPAPLPSFAPFSVTGDAAAPYVRFEITEAPLWDGFPWRILGYQTNQNVLQRGWPWNEETYFECDTPAHPSASSNLVSTGKNCCNTFPSQDRASTGHVTCYLKNLPQGIYEVTFMYQVRPSSTGSNAQAQAHLYSDKGASGVNEILRQTVGGARRTLQFDSKWEPAVALVKVGPGGEGRVFDYEPGATTSRNVSACALAVAAAEFGITGISSGLSNKSANLRLP